MTGWVRYAVLFMSIINAAALVYASRNCLHYFQLESYQFYGYVRSAIRQWKQAFLPGASLYLVSIITFNIIPSGDIGLRFVISLAASSVFSLMTVWFIKKKSVKKPLVITARIKRLVATLFIGLVLLNMAVFLFASFLLPWLPVPALLPVWVGLAGLVALPFEKVVFIYYFHDAQRKLSKHVGLVKIGITGSYGKTSVKFILQTILSQKFNVLATPASFNTPMGVARIIRDRLLPEHHIFLAEMGARHVGDIKEMCRLVHPSIGILTSVGPQHLDTFKTIERIAKTKNELMLSLPNDGFGVFSEDGSICSNLYQECRKAKMLAGGTDSDCWAEDIQVSHTGSVFTVCFKDGERINCETRLLGEHNVRNILLSCAVAKHLGLSGKQIKIGISMLQPVEHRLQLLRTSGNVTIIDDAFNSNPHGCHVALSVLKGFPGRRIIVTPGMVELGEKEVDYNHAFGAEMASCVDLAFLIGKKHTKPIVEGLLENGFPENDIHIMSDLGTATSTLNKLIRAGDVILYENDLPDHYNEN